MVEAQMNVNIFDAVVYFVLFITAAISFYRGFISEFISLVTWVGGAFITFSLAPHSTAFMSNYIQSATGAAIVGVLGTYFLVVVTLGILGKIVLRYIKKGTDVGWFDNILGLFLGLFKGAILITLGFILITIIYQDEESYPDWLKTASTVPTIQEAALKIVRIFPDSININSKLQEPTKEELLQQEVIESGNVQPNTPEDIDNRLIEENYFNNDPELNNVENEMEQNNSLEQLILRSTRK